MVELVDTPDLGSGTVGIAGSSPTEGTILPEWWNGRHGGLKIHWTVMSVGVRVSSLVQI